EPSPVPKYSRTIRQSTPCMCRDRVDDLQESRFRVADLLRGASQCFLRSLSLDGDYCDVICAFGRNRVNILRLPNLPGTFPHGCHSRIIVPLPDSMHFKICRKASSSDDCERITGNPESAGINRHVVGDERALQERKAANPSWPRVL